MSLCPRVQQLYSESFQQIWAIYQNQNSIEVPHYIEVTRRMTQNTADDLRLIEQEQERFVLQYDEYTKLNTTLQQFSSQPNTQQTTTTIEKLTQQKQNTEQFLNQEAAIITKQYLAIENKLRKTYHLLSALQARVLDDELIKWKREQQLAANGAIVNDNLDAIQEWCEALAELIWLNRTQIKRVLRLNEKLTLDPRGVQEVLLQLLTEITQLLKSLVASAFIVETQPPQVMKTNTRFTATVRLLVAEKLNIYMNPPQVKVTIISESQANVLRKNDKLGRAGDTCGEILNNTATMVEYQHTTRQLSACFRNMQLKKIKRAEKKGTDNVMNEKFSLLFQSQFNIGGGELVFQVTTLSLPVVVIVHGVQEAHAWATIIWDNAFAQPMRFPFQVPVKVPWSHVAETLSLKFRSATGRPLTEENLRFLAEKAFQSTNLTDLNNRELSWVGFCKEPLLGRNFTFWEWFYAVMKLIKEHLRGPWNDGAILGFIRKEVASEILAPYPNGTFLLRFSDSELGGVSIAWMSENSKVLMLQPFTSKDFAIRSLADRLADLRHLIYLYPDIDKNIVFKKYYTPFIENEQTTGSRYLSVNLVTEVAGLTSQRCASCVSTPEHSFLQFLDHTRDTSSEASSFQSTLDLQQTNHDGKDWCNFQY